MKKLTPVRQTERADEGAPTALNALVGHVNTVHVMAVLFAIGLTTFLAIDPTQNWLLLLLCGLSALGTDGIIRSHPQARSLRVDDKALFMIVPVLFTLAVGLFLEEVAEGFWTLAVGFLAGIPFWAILHAEYASVDRESPRYQSARLILNVATYLTAFLFFATIYDFDLGLVTAAFATGTVSLLLAIEFLREELRDTSYTLLYAAAIAILLSEGAWAVHFLPLEGGAAAVSLLLAFYLLTGLMHNHLAYRLSIRTAGEFAGIAALGLLIVTLSQAYL